MNFGNNNTELNSHSLVKKLMQACENLDKTLNDNYQQIQWKSTLNMIMKILEASNIVDIAKTI